MKNHSLPLIAALVVGAFTIPLTLNAQSTSSEDSQAGGRPGPGQAGPLGPAQGRPQQGQPGPGPMMAPQGPGGMAMGPMGGGRGEATMVADGSSLYILMGDRLIKVSKADLKIEKETSLRPTMPAGAPGSGPRGGGVPPQGSPDSRPPTGEPTKN
ncbi:MAG TPA: hypothetical protein PLO61_07445 [Fimbriimonadaceae bacterium]|nr:hypothetical protein [Fimbriimonadaceae bacterium]HRJ32961.1 hypothetical protein [Fimbriimonadaceae bacterium]